MNRKFYKILNGFRLFKVWRTKSKFVELRQDVEKIANIAGFESYLDIPTFMRQGKGLSS